MVQRRRIYTRKRNQKGSGSGPMDKMKGKAKNYNRRSKAKDAAKISKQRFDKQEKTMLKLQKKIDDIIVPWLNKTSEETEDVGEEVDKVDETLKEVKETLAKIKKTTERKRNFENQNLRTLQQIQNTDELRVMHSHSEYLNKRILSMNDKIHKNTMLIHAINDKLRLIEPIMKYLPEAKQRAQQEIQQIQEQIRMEKNMRDKSNIDWIDDTEDNELSIPILRNRINSGRLNPREKKLAVDELNKQLRLRELMFSGDEYDPSDFRQRHDPREDVRMARERQAEMEMEMEMERNRHLRERENLERDQKLQLELQEKELKRRIEEDRLAQRGDVVPAKPAESSWSNRAKVAAGAGLVGLGTAAGYALSGGGKKKKKKKKKNKKKKGTKKKGTKKKGTKKKGTKKKGTKKKKKSTCK